MPRKLSRRAAAQREKLNEQNSPLLKIPTEVRENIFIRVVAEEQPLSIVPPELGYSKKADTLVTQPPLSYVSRQCRREAIPLFYSENTFQLRCKLRESAREKIKSITNRSEPGWLLRERDNDDQLITFFNGSQHILENLKTVRIWLQDLCAAYAKALKHGVVLCCTPEDMPIVLEMATMRWDTMYCDLEPALRKTNQPQLIEGWKHATEEDVTKPCHGATMCHSKFVREKDDELTQPSDDRTWTLEIGDGHEIPAWTNIILEAQVGDDDIVEPPEWDEDAPEWDDIVAQPGYEMDTIEDEDEDVWIFYDDDDD